MIGISTVGGERLQVQILDGMGDSQKKPVILVIHGWTSEMARYPERFAPMVDMGYTCVLFDMRGHGKTGGDLANYSIKDHLDDCLCAYDYMASMEGVDLDNISVFGSSYGGYLASLLTGKRRVDQLVLKAPSQYPDDIFTEAKLSQDRGDLDRYRFAPHGSEDNMALGAISEFRGSALLIECQEDEQVPKQVLSDYRDAFVVGYDYELLEGADHSCRKPGAEQAMIDVLARWFKRFI